MYKKYIIVSVFVLLQSIGVAGSPQVSNITATGRHMSSVVDIGYDLVAENDSEVVFQYKNAAGAWIDVPLAHAAGHVGKGVAPGTNRHIEWDTSSAISGQNITPTGIKIIVDDGNLRVTLPGNVPLVLRKIPAGTFDMGSPGNEPGREADESPQQTVTFLDDFYMGTHEVTQRQWMVTVNPSFIESHCTVPGGGGVNPSFHFGDCDRPVDSASWNDIQGFLFKLALETAGQNVTFFLPTEAQWEYACRAGTTSAFNNGSAILSTGQAADGNLESLGWYQANSNRQPHPVGQKQPNAFGLYDMHGNLFEWCRDWYGDYEGGTQSDWEQPATGTGKVIRGGAWGKIAAHCRSAYRFKMAPDTRNASIGFRVVATASPQLVTAENGDIFVLDGQFMSVLEDSPNTSMDLSAVFNVVAATTYQIISNTNPGLFEAVDGVIITTTDPPLLILDYAENASGMSMITVSATDTGTGSSTQKMFTVSVSAVNDTPVVDGNTNITANEDDPDTMINLHGKFNDIEDGDGALQYQLTGAIDTDLFDSVTISGDPETLTLDYADNANGNATVMVIATDTGGLSITANFSVTVDPVNDPPVNSTLPSITVGADAGDALTATPGDWNDDLDLNQGPITFIYQWQRADDAGGGNLADIVGADGTTYAITKDDLGKWIRVAVRAVDDGVPGSQTTDRVFSGFLQAGVPHAGWQFNLTVTNGTPGSLALGMLRGATDGDDTGLDLPAPDVIGPGSVGLLNDSLTYQKDIRDLGDEAEWLLIAYPDINGFVLSWDDSVVLPSDRYLSLFEVVSPDDHHPVGTASFSLTDSGSFTLDHDGTARYFLLKYAQVAVDIFSFQVGWNLFSLPTVPDVSLSPDVVFIDDDATDGSVIYVGELRRWQDGAYHAVTELQALTGYWIYLADPNVARVDGAPVVAPAVTLRKGWNLIGPSRDTAIPLTLEGTVWRWNGLRFEIADQLHRRAGYWIYSSKKQVVPLP